MKSAVKIFALGILLGGFANAEYLGTYYAKLSVRDHFNSSGSARRAIVNGTPLIRVEIYRDHINVKVVRKAPRSVVR